MIITIRLRTALLFTAGVLAGLLLFALNLYLLSFMAFADLPPVCRFGCNRLSIAIRKLWMYGL